VQQMTELGASGYLTKHTAGDNLLLAIREVQREMPFSVRRHETFAGPLRHALADGKPPKRNVKLTSRQRRCCNWWLKGCRTSRARGTGDHAKTVNKHRQQLMNSSKFINIVGLTRTRCPTAW